MLDRLLGAAAALSMVVGAASAPAAPKASPVFTFQDPDIVESSGLVTDGDLFVTMNDSGDSGRIFTVDRSGRTVGVTSWAGDPVDDESLAPAGPGEVWVGDTGDNDRARDSITVRRVPYGVGDVDAAQASYELVYPDGAHDAETLMANPTTGQLFVVSKDIFGGTTYAVPRNLSADHPNRLKAVADGFAFATDGAFFPDGEHYVVRGYTSATIYTFPGHEPVYSFPLPTQDQGEGIAVGPDRMLYLSTEGQFSDVLRMRLPGPAVAAMAPPVTATPGPETDPVAAEPDTPDDDEPLWPWLLGGALAFVAGAGWLLHRRGQAS